MTNIAGYELADDAVIWFGDLAVMGPHVRGRSCSTCTACCTQVPVVLSPWEHKPANVRCKHLCSKGCRIYARRPDPCQVWSCRWLFDADTAELRRPDQAGYVIDCATDAVLATDRETGEQYPIHVLQIWVDPARREAHRDPALRRYLALMAERHQLAAIVRWSSEDGLVLFPPAMNSSGEWAEQGGEMRDAAHMATALRKAGVDGPIMAAMDELAKVEGR
jgi:hypothetical protein